MSALAPTAIRLPRTRAFLALTKPRILPLVVFTGIPVLGMTAGGWPPLATALAALLGIALAAAAANALNMYLERDRDALMERTRNRPLPAGAVSAPSALVFGVAVAALSTAVLWWTGGRLAAGVGVASILFYVCVYTLWLKPHSAYNAVLGAPAGAAAPLIADAAVHGHVGLPGLLLFAIIVAWQPPHVWAIALYRRDDYAAAGIPMMPAVIGEERTRRRMLWYSIGLVPITLLPGLLGLLGGFYLACAVVLNIAFLWSGIRLIRERSEAAARRVFRVSLVYLSLLYVAMLGDLLLRGLLH